MEDEEKRIFEAKAIGTYNLLRDDIALRLIQCFNRAKLVYRRTIFYQNDLGIQLAYFLEDLYGLVSATVEFLKSKEDRDWAIQELNNITVVPGDLLRKLKSQSEKEKKEAGIELNKYIAKKALAFFEKYKTKLKVSGLYDLRKFEVKPEYSYMKSM